MEGSLLTKSENNVDDVTLIHGDSSSNEEHNVHIADEHTVDITINGDSSSADEQTVPHEGIQWSNPFTSGCVWILAEFVVTLVQILAAICFLNLTKDEPRSELHVPLFIWIISYTCASIATFPIVCWRLWHNYNQDASSSGTSINEVMDGLEKFLESFFVCMVVVFLWYFFTELSSRDNDDRENCGIYHEQ
ncbi:uncharacterized protein LOC17897773 [Capsella rubella]|uniref:uncharacterized protein LOC17897773 n=1 Tax=Capsella rubella TaxID=81985 RepID=UPI000CD4BAF7|nr:uncharacterized protein LOC17897773 [Capsella rubella]